MRNCHASQWRHDNLLELLVGNPCGSVRVALAVPISSQLKSPLRLGRGRAPPLKIQCHSTFNQQFKLRKFAGWEGGPCPRSSATKKSQELARINYWNDHDWLSKLRRGQGPPSQPANFLSLSGRFNIEWLRPVSFLHLSLRIQRGSGATYQCWRAGKLRNHGRCLRLEWPTECKPPTNPLSQASEEFGVKHRAY